MLERLPAEYFDSWLWRGGSLATFGVETRYDCIEQSRAIIRRHAVGYCPGGLLYCRPKPGCVAVMFWTREVGHFWTHLTASEFVVCFPAMGEGKNI